MHLAMTELDCRGTPPEVLRVILDLTLAHLLIFYLGFYPTDSSSPKREASTLEIF